MIEYGTPEHVATQIEAAVGFPVYVTQDRYGLQINVTPDGCYGPGGAEGDLVLAEQVAAAIAHPEALVCACGLVCWDAERVSA